MVGTDIHHTQQNDYQSTESQQKILPRQIKSFGSKCAFITVESVDRNNWKTISIESAKKIDVKTNAYNWQQKVVFQLTKTELPIFACVLLGLLPSARFDNHGEQNKWFEIINQKQHFYFKSGGTNLGINVAPVPIPEAYMKGLLTLSQFAYNLNVSDVVALSCLEKMASQLRDSGSYKKPEVR